MKTGKQSDVALLLVKYQLENDTDRKTEGKKTYITMSSCILISILFFFRTKKLYMKTGKWLVNMKWNL